MPSPACPNASAAQRGESHLDLMKQVEHGFQLFSNRFSEGLNLLRIPAPMFVSSASLINDPLNDEGPVTFTTKSGDRCEIVHSLAKWKRTALKKLGLMESQECGIYCDLNAARVEEYLSDVHSYLVDQWDWELPIRPEDRTMDFLKVVVENIYKVIRSVKDEINQKYNFSQELPANITFVSSQELEETYPELTPKEREHAIAKEHGAVFLTGIGHKLSSGRVHDLRSADYDDWNLNGDIIVWSPKLGKSIELSSMGIRVDAKVLLEQMELLKKPKSDLNKQYYKDILSGELGASIGGGIGRSRMLVFLLERDHIAEVQSGFWPEPLINELRKEGRYVL